MRTPRFNRSSLQLVTLALFLACSLLVGQAERLLPTPIPGAKPGFANLFSLSALMLWGVGACASLTVARVILLGLLNGPGLFFFCSLAGALASAAVMSVLWWVSDQKIPAMPLSLCGALAHNSAQLAVAAWTLGRAVVFAYGPLMLFVGALSGLVVGFVSVLILGSVYKSGQI